MNPGLAVTVQRTPGGRSAAKSKTHSRSLVQRPVPRVASGSLQATASGAGAAASPKRTAGASNLATTWRTRATSPWGDRLVIVSAWAAPAAARASAAPVLAARRASVNAKACIGVPVSSWPLGRRHC